MRDLITLVCDGCKRKNYTSSKNKKKTTDKLSLKKFCPACRSHTLHKEGKVTSFQVTLRGETSPPEVAARLEGKHPGLAVVAGPTELRKVDQGLAITDGERVKVISRRGEGIFPALVVKTIRPDTIFIPYHWGEELAANQLTNPALDPTSKIPEYKACAARIEKIGGRELPIFGERRRGADRSAVTRLSDRG